MSKLVVGIDIGTTAIKIIVLDVLSLDKSEILKVYTTSHNLLSPKPLWAEEDPLIWKENLYSMLKEVNEDYGKSIEAISVTGMVPTFIALDKDKNPLYNSIQQNDLRAEDFLNKATNFFEGEESSSYFLKTGSHVNSQHIGYKWQWFIDKFPKESKKTKYIVGSYDYIRYLLCGNLNIELNWALESGLWNVKNNCWEDSILDYYDIKKEMLSEVVDSKKVTGTTTEILNIKTGLKIGIPVVAGSADHVVSAFATGATKLGDLVLKLGGAGDVLFPVDKLTYEDKLFLDYFPSKNCPFVLNGCTASSGSLLKWFKNEFANEDFKELDEKAALLPAGSDGVVVLPYFIGEKTPIFDAKARGVIYGLTLSHTKIHIYRAMLESIAFAFLHHQEVLKNKGLSVDRIFITNGGSTSPLWRQIMADVFQKDVYYIKYNPGSCLGAAFLAGMGIGILNENVIEHFTEQKLVSYTNSENYDIYEKNYYIYRNLYKSLYPLFHKK